MPKWYCAKSLESYRHDQDEAPFIVLENLVLFKAPDKQAAEFKASSIAVEQANDLGNVVLFGEKSSTVRFEGFRDLAALQNSEHSVKSGTTVSCSVFQLSEHHNLGEFIEQSQLLKITYLGNSMNLANSIVDASYLQPDNYSSEEPWECAHLIFEMIPTSSRLPNLIFEEVKIFSASADVWSLAEALGASLEQNREPVPFRSKSYALKFAGIRQVLHIIGPEVHSQPTDNTEVSHSVFEVESEFRMNSLLNGSDVELTLLPASLCHIQMGKEKPCI